MDEHGVQREAAQPNGSEGEALSSIGVVAIGRNEGERFERCVRSLVREVSDNGLATGTRAHIVYVDSGSTDGSVAFAQRHGVEVVHLDMTRPFTAARARKAGLERLLALSLLPGSEGGGVGCVQFLDGDCEMVEGWLRTGQAALVADSSLVAVSGRLRERFPEQTLYNRLGDLEWNRPVGEEKSCGGVAMMRVSAVQAAGGFDAGLIAGEEPELCARMRARGGRIVRIAHDMAWHDLAMTTSTQWLKRARRHGHAIIEVSYFKTRASRGLFVHQMRSAMVWVAISLVGISAASLFMIGILAATTAQLALNINRPVPRLTTPASLTFERIAEFALGGGWWLVAAIILPVVAWYLQLLRIAWQARRRHALSIGDSLRYGRLLMISKESQVRGMLDFLWWKWRGRDATVISYKESAKTARSIGGTP